MAFIRRSTQDNLTGLLNRESFEHRVRKVALHAEPGYLCVVFLRLLNLGTYGVRHGASVADDVLKLVATRLRSHLSSYAVGRFESGSFVAIAPTHKVEEILTSINRDLPSPDEADGLELKAGYCVLRDDLDIDQLILRARYAFEDIRYASPAFSRLFDSGLEAAFNRLTYVVEHLDDAIERGEIRAFAQPIVRVLTGKICEVEILARWESEQYGFLRPDEFVPELERRQLIHRLDAEVVRLACKQWAEASAHGTNVPFGINLSRLDFELCDMYQVVRDAMAAYEVPIGQVHIEVTESALAHSTQLLMRGISQFRSAGFELYLDDFGSGYSSLQVLEGTSFDVVKLDMSLLREVENNERARVIVADTISMVKRLNLQTLCEGVETEDQFLFLKAVGCEKAQGYFFSKPMSHEEIMSYLHGTQLSHETSEDQRYYNAIGKVNLIDGTRASVYGVEAAHFQGTQPFALIEIRGQGISFLSANVAFIRFVENSGSQSLDGFVRRLRHDLSDVRNKILYATSKCRKKNSHQRFDFVLEGNICTMGVSYVESSCGRDAHLIEVLSVTKYSQFNDFKLLEESLSFLYSLFTRIDLLDVTDNTWHNLYLNVPHYHALREGATPQDEIDAFCETFIHPDDRARFLEFYDLSTAKERLAHVHTVHLAETFFALSDTSRYDDQLFMLIPASIGGHEQYLSCMRDLDIARTARMHAGSGDLISDEVLLSGILDVTERLVFWKDDRKRFVGANQHFLDYYGFDSVESVLGKTDEDLGWTHNAHFDLDERRVLQGEQVLGSVGYTERRGELRDIRVSKMPLWLEGKVIGMVGFLVDSGPHKTGMDDPVQVHRRVFEDGYTRVMILGGMDTMNGPQLRKPLAASGVLVLVPPAHERAWIQRVLEKGPNEDEMYRLAALVEHAREHGAQAVVTLDPAVRRIAHELPLPVV